MFIISMSNEEIPPISKSCQYVLTKVKFHLNLFFSRSLSVVKKSIIIHKNTIIIKGVVHFFVNKFADNLLTPHPRCPCLSFFSRKEIKIFDENIPGFFSI